MMSWRLFAVTLLLSAGCAHTPDTTKTPTAAVRTMPSPDGCYLLVWDAEQYLGVSDYINGPRDYPTLRDLPNKQTWRNRIASVRVGPTAEAMAFTNENFQGASVPLLPGTSHPALPAAVTAQIKSLRVACRAPAAATR